MAGKKTKKEKKKNKEKERKRKEERRIINQTALCKFNEILLSFYSFTQRMVVITRKHIFPRVF